MKLLKDLKEEIINHQFNKFYVFYGEDYGLRHLYINEIGKSYNSIQTVDSYSDIASSNSSTGLFSLKTIYIIYNDIEFSKLSAEKLKVFLNRIKSSDCVIAVYEEALDNSTLFSTFSEYITHFPTVSDNIAYEFVDSELNLSLASKEELASNCSNNYNSIVLEADKIRNYAQSKGISHQLAYDELNSAGQLMYKPIPYNSNDLMNDILIGNFKSLSYWSYLINTYYSEAFWKSIPYIFNDYLIAYLIKRYGKYTGSNKAYDYGLSWNRTKTIREFIMPYSAEYLLDTAFEVSKLDINIKSGKLSNEELFDHFMCTII